MPQVLWTMAALVAAGYLLLFLARRNVSFRLVRLGWLAAAALLGRGLLLLVSAFQTWEWAAILACLAIAAGAWLGSRIWLVRAARDELRQRVSDACQGLRLQCQDSPSGLNLVERQQIAPLAITRLSPGLLVVHLPRLPRPSERSKVALLVQWLGKQYPGPIPPIRIQLSGRN